MWPNPHETADLVTFTVEILNGKLHFLSSEILTFLLKNSENICARSCGYKGIIIIELMGKI